MKVVMNLSIEKTDKKNFSAFSEGGVWRKLAFQKIGVLYGLALPCLEKPNCWLQPILL